ncbi:aminoglycoside phosphotransferase family protein [Streptomyces sp. x-80]|jgi:streptomycin 6-kinase|uniref:aminoglycoside phosphotransferase family protein n=1 Tax=Streptomyces sp. x-80 TaxID=2789282 RepID=UPI0039810CE8
MAKRTLGEIPTGCRQRLLTHYGPDAQPWLDDAPKLLEQAAERWKLSLGDYHDAGHASVIATATGLDGRPLLLKAWTDPSRYRHEVDTLRLWAGGPTADVVEAADDLAVAALELVGRRAGGADRPAHELQVVAAALRGLHTSGQRRPRTDCLPRLAEHLMLEVRPRIDRRARGLSLGGLRTLIEVELSAFDALKEDPGRATVLHADLYRENVLFDWRGHPRLIDPLPMVGDPAFDWAFWTVYYDLGRGTAERLATASRVSRIPVPELAPWCRLLAVDGLLFYTETGDPRVPRITEVLTNLLASTSRSGS